MCIRACNFYKNLQYHDQLLKLNSKQYRIVYKFVTKKIAITKKDLIHKIIRLIGYTDIYPLEPYDDLIDLKGQSIATLSKNFCEKAVVN